MVRWEEISEKCPVKKGQMCLAIARRVWKCSEGNCLKLSLNKLKVGVVNG